MKNKKTITVIILPDWKKKRSSIRPIATLRIPVRVIYYLPICFIMLICFGLNGSRAISKNIILHITKATLENSVEQLRSIEKKVDRISREQRIVCSFLGLENNNAAFSAPEHPGIGGTRPDFSQPSSLPVTLQEDMQQTVIAPIPLHKRVHDLYDAMLDLTNQLCKMERKLQNTPTIMPVQDDDLWITSWFGWRRSPFTGLNEFHKGLDISGKRGTPVLVTADGTVSEVGADRFLGNYIVIRHESRYTTVYGHLLQILVKKDQKVKRGQVIGNIGNTGISTGYHLHYEVLQNQKNVDPYKFILDRTDGILAANSSD